MTKLITRPGTDSHGYAYGTFDGIYELETQKGTSTVAEFVTDSLVPGETLVMRVFLSDYFGEDNNTGRFSKAMGFVFKAEYGETEEGVRQVISDNLDELDAYLDSLIGQRYKFKLIEGNNGFQNIDIASIRGVDANNETRKRKAFTVVPTTTVA